MVHCSVCYCLCHNRCYPFICIIKIMIYLASQKIFTYESMEQRDSIILEFHKSHCHKLVSVYSKHMSRSIIENIRVVVPPSMLHASMQTSLSSTAVHRQVFPPTNQHWNSLDSVQKTQGLVNILLRVGNVSFDSL